MVRNPNNLSATSINAPEYSYSSTCKECGFAIEGDAPEAADESDLCKYHFLLSLKDLDKEFNITIHSLNEKFFSTVTDHDKVVFVSRNWYNSKDAYGESEQYCKDNEYYGFEK